MIPCFSEIWLNQLRSIFTHGRLVRPRDLATRELLQSTVVVDMQKPVLRVPLRNLSYRFMVAEAYWILSGDDRVETIVPYNSNIAKFSDDGERFFGAYGPRIHSQLDYVVRKLRDDQQTRQAGLTIWRECPPPTKDVPCTVAVFFNIRGRRLNAHVFMRSSDAWLGLPYDVFNFSMLSYLVCARLHRELPTLVADLRPGNLHLTMASSHLYEEHWELARQCFDANEVMAQPIAPNLLWVDQDFLMTTLGGLRSSSPGDPYRWWEHPI